MSHQDHLHFPALSCLVYHSTLSTSYNLPPLKSPQLLLSTQVCWCPLTNNTTSCLQERITISYCTIRMRILLSLLISISLLYETGVQADIKCACQDASVQCDSHNQSPLHQHCIISQLQMLSFRISQRTIYHRTSYRRAVSVGLQLMSLLLLQ